MLIIFIIFCIIYCSNGSLVFQECIFFNVCNNFIGQSVFWYIQFSKCAKTVDRLILMPPLIYLKRIQLGIPWDFFFCFFAVLVDDFTPLLTLCSVAATTNCNFIKNFTVLFQTRVHVSALQCFRKLSRSSRCFQSSIYKSIAPHRRRRRQRRCGRVDNNWYHSIKTSSFVFDSIQRQ